MTTRMYRMIIQDSLQCLPSLSQSSYLPLRKYGLLLLHMTFFSFTFLWNYSLIQILWQIYLSIILFYFPTQYLYNYSNNQTYYPLVTLPTRKTQKSKNFWMPLRWTHSSKHPSFKEYLVHVTEQLCHTLGCLHSQSNIQTHSKNLYHFSLYKVELKRLMPYKEFFRNSYLYDCLQLLTFFC